MVESPWVVIDTVKEEMRCDRCGGASPMVLLYGQRLEFVAGVMDVFARVHAGCEEKVTP